MDQKIIVAAEVPSPLTLVKSPDGSCTALMFYWLAEGAHLAPVASEEGFDLTTVRLGESSAEELALHEAYDDGQNVLDRWVPAGPDGSVLVAKWDSEDGPVAYFATPHRRDEAARDGSDDHPDVTAQRAIEGEPEPDTETMQSYSAHDAEFPAPASLARVTANAEA